MIDAKELRIGNLVNDVGSMPFKVDAVDIVTLSQCEVAGRTHLGYNPIPLTPEILVACGFVNSTDVHWCVPSNDPSKSFEICVWSDHVSYTMSSHFHLTLNYLHQLQNLYYALTQTELNIKL